MISWAHSITYIELGVTRARAMTTTRVLSHLLGILLMGAAFSVAIADPAAAQNPVRVQIRNVSTAPLNVAVFDEVCRQTVFSGWINARAQRPVTLCPYRGSEARITVLDRFGEQRKYRIRQGQVLSIRARYGSGGLGR